MASRHAPRQAYGQPHPAPPLSPRRCRHCALGGSWSADPKGQLSPIAMSSSDSTSRLEEALNALLQVDDASCTATFAGKPPRGVTRHKRSGRWESHVWHQRKQLYVGGWASEHAAARAFDVVCLQSRGAAASKVLNFPVADYQLVIPLLAGIGNPELVALLRRRSKGWSRGKSSFRGVTHHRSGRFEARISGGIGRTSKQCACSHPSGEPQRALTLLLPHRRVPRPLPDGAGGCASVRPRRSGHVRHSRPHQLRRLDVCTSTPAGAGGPSSCGTHGTQQHPHSRKVGPAAACALPLAHRAMLAAVLGHQRRICRFWSSGSDGDGAGGGGGWRQRVRLHSSQCRLPTKGRIGHLPLRH
jgi:hypothetical protein